jgi:hypothetical protein
MHLILTVSGARQLQTAGLLAITAEEIDCLASHSEEIGHWLSTDQVSSAVSFHPLRPPGSSDSRQNRV